MPRLDARDLGAILEFTLEARSFDSLEAFRIGVLPGLRRLVPCDIAGYNEIDLDTRTAFGVFDPPGTVHDDVPEHFAQVMHQHPLIARVNAGDRRAYMISDFLTERAYHRLELYQDVLRVLAVEDQMALALPGELIVGIALNRDRRTFTERDRDVLDLLRPHVADAYLRVRERERAAALAAALDDGLEQHDGAVLLLDGAGRIAGGSAQGRELLAAYTGRAPEDGDRLPEALEASGRPLRATISGPRGLLRVRELCDGDGRGWRAVLLEEQRARPPSVEALRELGLTNREAEVLRLLACGKPNRQIAAELGIGIGTVRKHLEHVYDHLGVSSRAQAIARVLG